MPRTRCPADAHTVQGLQGPEQEGLHRERLPGRARARQVLERDHVIGPPRRRARIYLSVQTAHRPPHSLSLSLSLCRTNPSPTPVQCPEVNSLRKRSEVSEASEVSRGNRKQPASQLAANASVTFFPAAGHLPSHRIASAGQGQGSKQGRAPRYIVAISGRPCPISACTRAQAPRPWPGMCRVSRRSKPAVPGPACGPETA